LGSLPKKIYPLRRIGMTDFDPVVDGGHSQIASEESAGKWAFFLVFSYFVYSMTSVFARMI
jgi:hypothetical protein